MCSLRLARIPAQRFQDCQGHQQRSWTLETYTFTVNSQLKDFMEWPNLEQIFKLERHSKTNKTGEVYVQVVYSFTSLMWE
jgi:hypothetical protein